MISMDRIGVFTPSAGITDADECLKFIKAHGGLIQAWTISPELAHETKPGLGFETIMSEVEKGTVRVSSLSGYMDWTAPEKNELRLEEFRRVIGQCRACKTSIVCTETGRVFDGRDDRRAWDVLIASMRTLSKEAGKAGVSIAIEMGPRDLIFGRDLFRRLQDSVGSPALKINFDPANLLLGGLDPIEELQRLKGDVVHVHLKDARRNPRGQVDLTTGEVDFRQLFGILEDCGYQGDFIIEQEHDGKTAPLTMAEAYENVGRLLKEK